MPKVEGAAPRQTRNLDQDLAAGILIDFFLVYVPGNRKFRCIYCDALFDTIVPPHGAYIVWERDLSRRVGTACGECVTKIEEHGHA